MNGATTSRMEIGATCPVSSSCTRDFLKSHPHITFQVAILKNGTPDPPPKSVLFGLDPKAFIIPVGGIWQRPGG